MPLGRIFSADPGRRRFGRLGFGLCREDCRARGRRVDDQHVVAKIFFVLDDRFAALVERHVGFGCLALGHGNQLLLQLFLVGAVDGLDRLRDFAQVAEENVAPLAFLLHAHAAAHVHAQLPANRLQRQS